MNSSNARSVCNAPAKVLHLTPTIRRGGAERQLSLIIENSMSVSNYIATLYLSDISYDFGGVKPYHIKGKNFFSRLMQLCKIFSSLLPDVVYAWDLSTLILAKVASISFRVVIVNGSIRHGVLKRDTHGVARALVARLSSIVIANSRAGLIANGVHNGRVLYNGVADVPSKTHGNDDKAFNRKQISVPIDKVVLISVANFVPFKDYHTVIRALTSLRSRGLEFFYIIVGEGPQRKQIEALVNESPVHGSVLFTGLVSDVDVYLRISDIMIHSSFGEGCSNAILEAMKNGLPIIATDVGGTKEIVDETNALLYDYGDRDTLMRHVEKLMRETELRQSMGVASHSIVKQRFAVEKMIDNYEQLISDILMNKLCKGKD